MWLQVKLHLYAVISVQIFAAAATAVWGDHESIFWVEYYTTPIYIVYLQYYKYILVFFMVLRLFSMAGTDFCFG